MGLKVRGLQWVGQGPAYAHSECTVCSLLSKEYGLLSEVTSCRTSRPHISGPISLPWRSWWGWTQQWHGGSWQGLRTSGESRCCHSIGAFIQGFHPHWRTHTKHPCMSFTRFANTGVSWNYKRVSSFGGKSRVSIQVSLSTAAENLGIVFLVYSLT